MGSPERILLHADLACISASTMACKVARLSVDRGEHHAFQAVPVCGRCYAELDARWTHHAEHPKFLNLLKTLIKAPASGE
jgi:hypothetical protein